MTQHAFPFAEQRTRDLTRRANQVSKRAAGRRAHGDLRQLRLAIAAGLVFGAADDLKRRRKYSDEVVRDSRIPVEPAGDESARIAYVRYRAALVLRGTFEPMPGLPGETRASCPPDRAATGCPFVRCRHHLWRIDGGPDGNRAGRPGLSSVPRDKRGLTLRVLGDAPGDYPESTVEPRWLEPGCMPDTCSLDVACRGKHSNEEIGVVTNRHRTLIGRLVPDAMGHAIEAAASVGMTREDLARGLMEIGEVGI